MADEVAVAEGCFYTETHEWVRIEGDTAIVGIADYAQKELGDITFVEFQYLEGDAAAAGDVFAVVEAVKASEECFLPLGGEVLENNPGLEDEPELVNSSPYRDGWIVKLRLDGEPDTSGLMDAGSYREFLKTQGH